MRFYLHIVTDTERIIDPDGQQCIDLEAARAEAQQSARALMADELQAGRRAPFGWRVQIADGSGTILDTVSFADLAFGRKSGIAAATTRELIERAQALAAMAQERHAEVLKHIDDAHSHLRTLARLHAALLKQLS